MSFGSLILVGAEGKDEQIPFFFLVESLDPSSGRAAATTNKYIETNKIPLI